MVAMATSALSPSPATENRPFMRAKAGSIPPAIAYTKTTAILMSMGMIVILFP